MANLFDLKKQRQFALAKCENILKAAEDAGNRELTAMENLDLETCQAAVNALNPRIAAIEKNNSLATVARFNNGVLIPSGASAGEGGARGFSKPKPAYFTQDYANDFYASIASAGKNMEPRFMRARAVRAAMRCLSWWMTRLSHWPLRKWQSGVSLRLSPLCPIFGCRKRVALVRLGQG